MDARRRSGLICLGLTLAAGAAYWQIWQHGFINFDDPDYVTANPHVRAGLTWAGIAWAFTTFHASNWHPLTWISHMLDCQLYGDNPAGHHVTNLVLHVAATVFLFLALQRLTRETWPPAWVAALFALHPAHVESVAWASERKDVLSGLFWMLALFFWAKYADGKSRSPGSNTSYGAAVVCFALGLLAKPMIVTLPCVLILLDYWPAERAALGIRRLLVEKSPFFALTILSCVVTFFSQRAGGAVIDMSRLGIGDRLTGALVAYARYLGELFWPVDLAVWYPSFAWPAWEVAGSLLLLAGISAATIRQARRRPWMMVGWLWFLGTLVPVIGLVQVGVQSMADRYTYVPGIGIFIIVAWAGRELAGRCGRWLVAVPAVATLACSAILTARQNSLWTDSLLLFRHTVQCTKNNYYALEMLGALEQTRGLTNEAVHDLETSIRIYPKFGTSHAKLGHVLLDQGRISSASNELTQAISLDPKLPDAHYDLGYILLTGGQTGEALDQFQQQVNLEPEDFRAQQNMGSALLRNGLARDAIPYLQKATQIDPTTASAHFDLATALFHIGRTADAVSQYEESLGLDSGNSDANNNLAWILATSPDAARRDGQRAVKLALAADHLAHGSNAVVAGTLGAAYAESGNFPAAIDAENRALALAHAQTNTALIGILETRLESYRAKKSWRDGTR